MTTEENQTPAVELESDISVDSTPAPDTSVATDEQVATPSLLDAISAGVESAPVRGPKQPVDEKTGDVEGEPGSGAGKGEKKDGAEDGAEGLADKSKDDAADKKAADHVGDPIPAEWSERARERITSLVSSVKEKDSQLETQGNLINAVISTGASPEQFGGIITFLRDFNGQDPAGLERCQQALQTMLEGVSLRMGKPIAGVDFLAKYPELKQAVHYGQITAEHAQELAIAREARTRAATHATATAEQQRTTDAATLERNTAITEMNEMGDSLQATDPDYQRKYDMIVGPLTEAFKDLPPRQWKAAFTRAWNAVKLPPAPPPPPPPSGGPQMERDPVTGQFRPVKKGQPIRPVAPSGTSGAKAAPKSLREAIDFSLAGDGN